MTSFCPSAPVPRPESSTLDEQLWDAVVGNEVSSVRQLLRDKASPDACVGESTALFVAAAGGKEKAVLPLLDAKANPRIARESDGQTALHVAHKSGHHGVVSAILAVYSANRWALNSVDIDVLAGHKTTSKLSECQKPFVARAEPHLQTHVPSVAEAAARQPDKTQFETEMKLQEALRLEMQKRSEDSGRWKRELEVLKIKLDDAVANVAKERFLREKAFEENKALKQELQAEKLKHSLHLETTRGAEQASLLRCENERLRKVQELNQKTIQALQENLADQKTELSEVFAEAQKITEENAGLQRLVFEFQRSESAISKIESSMIKKEPLSLAQSWADDLSQPEAKKRRI